MDKNCLTCKFFEYDKKPRRSENGIGLCHRYPRLHLDGHDCYYIDVVDKTDWCGEWRPIETEPKEVI